MEILTFILLLLVIYKNDISRVIHVILQKLNQIFRRQQTRNIRFTHRRDHNRHRVVNLDERELD